MLKVEEKIIPLKNVDVNKGMENTGNGNYIGKHRAFF